MNIQLPIKFKAAYFLPILFSIYSFSVFAQETDSKETLPVIEVSADALDPDDPRVTTVSTATKTQMNPKDIPQTIDSIDVSKFKAYGINDLSIMLNGIAGVDTSYDMRGEGIMLRGFEASSGDIYRDGIRASGQIRRSTANVERIEILKGPASVLYGRGSGGGIVNMISREANFHSPNSISVRAGRWDMRGLMADVNHVLSPNWAVRLTVDKEKAHSFRRGIENENTMVSPSITYAGNNGLTWTGQYTYDKVWRIPDRGPSFNTLPDDVSIKTAYAHPDDYVEDRLNMWRSVLSYEFSPDWSVKWTFASHKAEQNFDHLYAGRYNTGTGLITFTRAWQETTNKTQSNMLDLSGKFNTGNISHEILLGAEYTDEKRQPMLATASATSGLSWAYPYGVDPYDPQWTNPKAPHAAPTQYNDHRARTKAVYIQDLITLNPQWKILAGLRYEGYKFSSHNLLNNTKRSYQDNSLSPRIGLIWQPVPQHSIYASYSKSFAPYGGRGMISIATGSTAVFDDDPQYSRQYEIGIKSDWLGDKFSSHFALFQIEKYNIRYRPDPTNDPYHWAVQGEQRSRGVDLSITGQILPNWYIRSSIGYQDAKVITDRATPANEGKHLTGVSNVNGSIFLRYVPTPQWYGEFGVISKSSAYTNAANTTELPGYTTWNASIGWRPAPWTVSLSFINLTDKRYWRSSSMPGTPRSVLLNVSYMF